MISSNDATYYRRRERECRAKAQNAIDPKIGAIHTEMADAYRGRLGDAPHDISAPRERLSIATPR